MDVDEFIVPLTSLQLSQLLDALLKTNVGSVTFIWKCYGTSGLWDIPNDRLMTECLIFRSNDQHPSNFIGKAIHKPEAITKCYIHEARHVPPYTMEIRWDFRINHYQYRGRKEALCKEPIRKVE